MCGMPGVPIQILEDPIILPKHGSLQIWHVNRMFKDQIWHLNAIIFA